MTRNNNRPHRNTWHQSYHYDVTRWHGNARTLITRDHVPTGHLITTSCSFTNYLQRPALYSLFYRRAYSSLFPHKLNCALPCTTFYWYSSLLITTGANQKRACLSFRIEMQQWWLDRLQGQSEDETLIGNDTVKGRFPLPEFTALVHGPSWRPENSGAVFWHPSTRAVNSGSGNRTPVYTGRVHGRPVTAVYTAHHITYLLTYFTYTYSRASVHVTQYTLYTSEGTAKKFCRRYLIRARGSRTLFMLVKWISLFSPNNNNIHNFISPQLWYAIEW